MGKHKKYLPALVFLLALFGLTAAIWPLVRWMAAEENLLVLRDYLHSRGPLGLLLFLLLQVAQVILAVIPGEPVELAAGLLYGAFWGLGVSLLGVMIGSTLIFLLVRRFGQPLVLRFYPPEKLHNYRFMHDAQRLDLLIFLMFLIPGTPKDMLTYICPLTPISLGRFLLISTFARIPSVVTSTLAGASLSQGRWILSLGILLLTSVIGLMGIAYEKRLTARLNLRARQTHTNLHPPKPPDIPTE